MFRKEKKKKLEKNFLVLDALFSSLLDDDAFRRRQALEKRTPYFFTGNRSSAHDVSPPRSVSRAQSLAAWRGVSGDARGDFREREWSFWNVFLMGGALKFCVGVFLSVSLLLPHRGSSAARFLSSMIHMPLLIASWHTEN